MHTVELLEQCCEVAQQLGFQIRHEWLGGTGGGACEFAGRKWIFIDLALNVDEQLAQVAGAIRDEPGLHFATLRPSVARYLGVRRAA